MPNPCLDNSYILVGETENNKWIFLIFGRFNERNKHEKILCLSDI